MTKPPSIKELAEKICPPPVTGGYARRINHDDDNWLNEITRIESILVEFKREIVEAYQGRIEQLEDQLATSEAEKAEYDKIIEGLPRTILPVTITDGTVYAPATED